MLQKEKFKNYTAIQLATDVDFVSWVKWPDEASNLFWKEFIKKYPYQEAAVLKARGIIDKMHIVQPALNETASENTWQEIVHKIEAENAKKYPLSISIYKKWMAAADVILFMMGGAAYFLLQNSTADKLVRNSLVIPTNDIAPGGNVATLTLSDGSTISLDSANIGSLAQQGLSTIIKLNDGQLAYKGTAHNAASKEIQYNTVTTPRGGQYQLVLADGSKVWLNAASSIRFPAAFTGDQRNVEITGEVYFEVAHNATKPFIVKANAVDIKVLGTSFNVNAYEDE
ncbi:MAG: FecR domain-containing protein, partial [Ginsengibacter sp.]